MTNHPQLPSFPARGSSRALKGLMGLAVAVALLGAVWWWSNRPIQPVQLSPQEITALEAKMEAIRKPSEPTYEKGTNEIVLTERELNGLLNENTAFGKSVSFQLASDAIHARVETDLDPDLPVVGGKHLKARARFFVKTVAGRPSLIMDDVTIWGVSLPNEWLAGLKGRDLLGEMTASETNAIAAGVEEIKVEPGRLVIRLAD
jgi:hypothetical protein